MEPVNSNENSTEKIKDKKKIITVAVAAAAAAAVIVIGIIILISNRGNGNLKKNLDLGNKYLLDMNYEEAVLCFEKALDIDPLCADAYIGLADAYAGKGDYEKAIEILNTGIDAINAYIADKPDDKKAADLERLKSKLDEIQKSYQNEQEKIAEEEDKKKAEEEAEVQEESLAGLKKAELSEYEWLNARNGIAVVGKDNQYGIVTYDNKEIVPLIYTHGTGVFNDDNETVLGDGSVYYVFDKDGNTLAQIDKSVKSASEGVILWTNTDEDTEEFSFGYVDYSGKELYTSQGENYNIFSGAVGVNEGFGIFDDELSSETLIRPSGELIKIGDERLNRKKEEEKRRNAAEASTGVSDSGIVWEANAGSEIYEFQYPVGVCSNGCYLSRGHAGLDDLEGVYYINYIDSMTSDVLSIRKLAEREGFEFWSEDFGWSFYGYNENGCNSYNVGEIAALKIHYGDKSKAYFIDTKKTTYDSIPEDAIILECEEATISQEKYWLYGDGNGWGYVDASGSRSEMFDDACEFSNGYALVVKDGKIYLIDENLELTDTGLEGNRVLTVGDLFRVISDDDTVEYYYYEQ